MCKFSIIIPNYNKGQYIRECLDSVFNQDIEKDKYEVIVVEDGSTDNSLEIIKEYPVRLFHTNRKRAGGARNVGIENAKGEYIIFLDSDDYLAEKNVLSKLDEKAINQDIIALPFIKNNFGTITLIKDEFSDMKERIQKTKILGCVARCYKRELIKDIRFTEMIAYEDVCFSLESLCKCKTYDYLEDPFFIYRKVENSNTTQEVSGKVMTDLVQELSKMYYLCFKYPEYKLNILERIKADRLPLRLELLNDLIEKGENNFRKYF